MKNVKKIGLFIILVQVCILTALFAKNVNNPDLIPENSIIVLSSGNFDTQWNIIKQTPAYAKYQQIISDPLITNDSNYQKFQIEVKKIETEVGVPLSLETFMTKLFKGVDFCVAPIPNSQKMNVIAIINIKDKALVSKIIAKLEEIVNKPAAPAPGVTPAPQVKKITTEDYNGVKIKLVGDQDKRYYAEMGDLFIFSGDLNLMKNTIDRSKGAIKTSIKNHKKFQDIMNTLTKQYDFYVFFDYTNLFKNLQGMMMPFGGKTALMESMVGEVAIGGGGKINKDSFEFEGLVPYDPNSKYNNYEYAKKFPPTASKILKYCPQNAILIGQANTFDGTITYDSIIDLVTEMMKMQNPQSQISSPGQATPQGQVSPKDKINAQIAAIEAQLQFNIKNDLFQNLGTDVGFIFNSISIGSGMMAMMPTIDTAIILETKNPAKIIEVMKKLETFITNTMNAQFAQSQQATQQQTPQSQPQVSFLSEQVGNISIRYLSIPMLPYTPAYAIDDKLIIISTTKDFVKNYLNNKSAVSGTYIADPDYSKIKTIIGDKTNSYVDINVKAITNTIKTFIFATNPGANQNPETKKGLLIIDGFGILSHFAVTSSYSQKGSVFKSYLLMEEAQPSIPSIKSTSPTK